MEDVALRPNCQFFTTQQGASLQVYDIVTRCLAKFHAKWITDETCQMLLKMNKSWLLANAPTYSDNSISQLWKDNLPSIRKWLSADVEQKTSTKLAPNWCKYRTMEGSQYNTLGHGDFRLDNMAIDVANKKVVVFDWQNCGIKNGMSDVTIWLSTQLEPGQLETMYPYLMKAYFDHVPAKPRRILQDC